MPRYLQTGEIERLLISELDIFHECYPPTMISSCSSFPRKPHGPIISQVPPRLARPGAYLERTFFHVITVAVSLAMPACEPLRIEIYAF
jgi:hypothetical protein